MLGGLAPGARLAGRAGGGLTIPLVLAATFFVMSLMGIDLHRISLGALIIALGLLVDDAMIAVEMMDRKLQEGYDKLRAATFAYTSTAFPMLTGTLITVAGFIPVGFAQSQAGEYVSALFWVTGISLMISWFAAVYFTPWIGYRLLRVASAKAARTTREAFDTPRLSRDPRRRGWCVRCAAAVVVLTFVAWPRASPASLSSRKQFFPTSNRPEILVDLWLPEGTSFAETEQDAKRLEQRLLRGSRHRLRHHLRRRRRAALLSAARPAAEEPELRPAAADVEIDSRRASGR